MSQKKRSKKKHGNRRKRNIKKKIKKFKKKKRERENLCYVEEDVLYNTCTKLYTHSLSFTKRHLIKSFASSEMSAKAS